MMRILTRQTMSKNFQVSNRCSYKYSKTMLIAVVSEILRTFASEWSQMTNVSWRSRSNRPTRELRRSRSAAKAEPLAFLPYTAFVKFASIHILACAPHFIVEICLSLAPTSIIAEYPSGKLPTTRVRRRISFMMRSRPLFVRNRLQCSYGKSM